MNNQCDGCIRKLPVFHGVHVGEQELFMCSAHRYLELEPKERDTWYQPDKRLLVDVPFTCGSGQ